MNIALDAGRSKHHATASSDTPESRSIRVTQAITASVWTDFLRTRSSNGAGNQEINAAMIPLGTAVKSYTQAAVGVSHYHFEGTNVSSVTGTLEISTFDSSACYGALSYVQLHSPSSSKICLYGQQLTNSATTFPLLLGHSHSVIRQSNRLQRKPYVAALETNTDLPPPPQYPGRELLCLSFPSLESSNLVIQWPDVFHPRQGEYLIEQRVFSESPVLSQSLTLGSLYGCLQNCNGNGVCNTYIVSDSRSRSFCQCLPSWTGVSCSTQNLLEPTVDRQTRYLVLSNLSFLLPVLGAMIIFRCKFVRRKSPTPVTASGLGFVLMGMISSLYHLCDHHSICWVWRSGSFASIPDLLTRSPLISIMNEVASIAPAGSTADQGKLYHFDGSLAPLFGGISTGVIPAGLALVHTGLPTDYEGIPWGGNFPYLRRVTWSSLFAVDVSAAFISVILVITVIARFKSTRQFAIVLVVNSLSALLLLWESNWQHTSQSLTGLVLIALSILGLRVVMKIQEAIKIRSADNAMLAMQDDLTPEHKVTPDLESNHQMNVPEAWKAEDNILNTEMRHYLAMDRSLRVIGVLMSLVSGTCAGIFWHQATRERDPQDYWLWHSLWHLAIGAVPAFIIFSACS